jgi:hypothetical protein
MNQLSEIMKLYSLSRQNFILYLRMADRRQYIFAWTHFPSVSAAFFFTACEDSDSLPLNFPATNGNPAFSALGVVGLPEGCPLELPNPQLHPQG